MSTSLRQYTAGSKSVTEFKRDLYKNKINVNPYMDKLFRRADAGETINYSVFGKEIFKQIEQDEPKNPMYMRSTTPTTNNFKNMSMTHRRSSAYGIDNTAPHPVSKNMSSDITSKNDIESNEFRNIGVNYIPKKGLGSRNSA